MKVNDIVTVNTDGDERREGVVLAVESFLEGTMYLVALADYPAGIWFFNEVGKPEGTFVELKRRCCAVIQTLPDGKVCAEGSDQKVSQ